MNIPQEFVESFEGQYPKVDVNYKLPKSLDKFPKIKVMLDEHVLSTFTLGLVVEVKGIVYDLLNMRYWYPEAPDNDFELTPNGKAIISAELYSSIGTNKSEKLFEYLMDDLTGIDVVKFNAELMVQVGNYDIVKSINVIEAWMQYCKDTATFKMDYDEYSKMVGIIK